MMGIHAKLLAAQKAITAIGKTGHNDHFNYDFFEEREVLRVAREALNDAGLVFFYSVDSVADREVTTAKGRDELLTDVTMTCSIFDAETGESVQGGAIGRGQDGQDKGVNKAIVAGLKYWLLKTLMIPTNDDTERTENTNPEGNQHRPRRSSSAPSGATALACPKCGGDMWDNRVGKKNPKMPDLKCKDRDGCDHAIWIDSWERELLEEIEAAHKAGLIDAEARAKAEEAVAGRDLPMMLKMQARLNAMAKEAA